VVAAVGQRAVIARRDEQEPTALAAIRTRQAEIDDPLPPPVVEHSQRLRRRLDDHRPRSQIDHAEEIGRVGVRGQKQRCRIHQLREDQDLVVVRSRLREPLAQRHRRGARVPVEKHVQGVHVVEVVVHGLDGLASGHAVDEFERPEPGLELVRRRDGAKRVAGHGHVPPPGSHGPARGSAACDSGPVRGGWHHPYEVNCANQASWSSAPRRLHHAHLRRYGWTEGTGSGSMGRHRHARSVGVPPIPELT
jgi:hypothetical protein